MGENIGRYVAENFSTKGGRYNDIKIEMVPTLLKNGKKPGLISLPLPFPTATSMHIAGLFIFVCSNHY